MRAFIPILKLCVTGYGPCDVQLAYSHMYHTTRGMSCGVRTACPRESLLQEMTDTCEGLQFDEEVVLHCTLRVD